MNDPCPKCDFGMDPSGVREAHDCIQAHLDCLAVDCEWRAEEVREEIARLRKIERKSDAEILCLIAEITRLRAKVEELRGAMRSLEFCVMTWTSVDEQYRCPSCWRTEDDGHFASCRLDAALNDARKGEEES